VNRLHARATFRPARQLMFVTRSLVLCTAVSPGPFGGTQVRPTEDCPAVPEPQAPANPSSVNATTTRYLRMCILISPLGDAYSIGVGGAGLNPLFASIVGCR
jgi:hypothetical protein